MNYRRFGPLGWKSSILGLGVKKLPSIELIRYAMDQGVTYVDLGYPFDRQRHEAIARLLGKALEGGYRDKIKISVTLPSHLISRGGDFSSYLMLQLGWLKVDYADFCVLGKLNRASWPILQRFGILEWLESARRAGLIEHAGFSFHDHYQMLRTILHSYDGWTLSQFEFSYMDAARDPGLPGIQYAASRGLAVVVSDPLRNGRLSMSPPKEAAAIWAEAGPPWSPTEWAWRFVWNYSEISTAVCNTDSFGEISQCVAWANSSAPDQLSVRDEIAISRAREAYLERKPLACTSCRACMPCPEGIDVPRVFEIYNDVFIYDDLATARSIYAEEQHELGLCTECGDCETRCAKRLPVMDWLKKAKALLPPCKAAIKDTKVHKS